MKKTLKQLAATQLSVLMLLSTVSLHLDMHFCGEHLVDFSLMGRTTGCGDVVNAPDGLAECPMAAMECCTDEAIVLQGQEDLQSSYSQITLERPDFTLPPLSVYRRQGPCALSDKAIHSFADCSPPPLIREIYLLHNTFLI